MIVGHIRLSKICKDDKNITESLNNKAYSTALDGILNDYLSYNYNVELNGNKIIFKYNLKDTINELLSKEHRYVLEFDAEASALDVWNVIK
jgi:hypothetical protein